MMTREEAIEYVNEFVTDSANIFGYAIEASDISEFINQIYDELEQHIKSLEAQLSNTEQLTCNGCKY